MTKKTNDYKVQLPEKPIVVLQQAATLEVRTVKTLVPALTLRVPQEDRNKNRRKTGIKAQEDREKTQNDGGGRREREIKNAALLRAMPRGDTD